MSMAMTSIPPPPSFHFPVPIQIPSLPAKFALLLHHKPSILRRRCRPRLAASLSSPPTSFPYSFSHHFGPNPNPDDEPDDDQALGDCLVFDDGAFEDAAIPLPVPRPRHTDKPPRPRRHPPASVEVTPETLVPEKWKEVAEKLNYTKKERRIIARQDKFQPRRKLTPVPDAGEYRAYREMKMGQLKPVVLDRPGQLPSKKDEGIFIEEMKEPPERGRAAPRNPRVGLGAGTMEDIADFFNSDDYTPGVSIEEKKLQGKKLFTQEEKTLLNKRIPDLAVATSNKWMPVHTLAASGEFYLLDMLLKHNVDINGIDKDGFSAIHRAVIGKKQAIINYLLRNSVNPFIRDKEGATLLHYAVQTASTQTIKILLLYNVDINLADDDGWTPLHLAVQTQRTDIVRLLLIKGADRTLKSQNQVCRATQLPTRDLMDLNTLCSWLNFPMGQFMEDEIYKAANTFCGYTKVGPRTGSNGSGKM